MITYLSHVTRNGVKTAADGGFMTIEARTWPTLKTGHVISVRGRRKMNNCKFLQYPHFCIVCKSPIDMKKIERYVFDCIRYEHKPELMPPHRDNDPIIVKDYGNDVEIICGIKCAESYLFDQIQVNKNQLTGL